MVETRPFKIGLGLSMPEDSPQHSYTTDDLTHPINSKLSFSLAKRPLGDAEQQRLGSNTALVPHYSEHQAFPFRNSSSIPDMTSYYSNRPSLTTSQAASQGFDFSTEEHASMRMDPHEHNVPGLSADSGSMTMSESSDAVLSPLPHPLGSRLDLWHEANRDTSRIGPAPQAQPQVQPQAHRPAQPIPTSADDTINTVQINYTGKKRFRHPSLIRTPNTVCTADWADAFNQKYTWVRGQSEPKDGLLQPGLPTLPTFPTKALIVDEMPCDQWGRRECAPKVAAITIVCCTVFPPLWLLVGAGYFDGIVGVVPRKAKYLSFGLGLATLCAALILALCLALL